MSPTIRDIESEIVRIWENEIASEIRSGECIIKESTIVGSFYKHLQNYFTGYDDFTVDHNCKMSELNGQIIDLVIYKNGNVYAAIEFNIDKSKYDYDILPNIEKLKGLVKSIDPNRVYFVSIDDLENNILLKRNPQWAYGKYRELRGWFELNEDEEEEWKTSFSSW